MSALCLDISPRHHSQPTLSLPRALPAAKREAFESGYLFIWFNVASWGLLKSQKARLLTARQISFLFALPMTHAVASFSLKSFAPSLRPPDLYHRRGKKQNTSVLKHRSVLFFVPVVLSFIDSERCVMTTKCNRQQLSCVQIWRMLWNTPAPCL